MTIARHALRTVGVLIAATVLGVAGLIVAELVPDQWVVDALEDAEAAGAIDADERPADASGAQIDEFSECIALSVGLAETEGQSVWNTTALAPHLGGCDRLIRNLFPYDGATAAADRGTYLRYWHGTAPVLRPTLALFGIAGVRVVAMLAMAVAGAALLGVVRRVGGTRAAVGLAVPVVLTTSIAALPESSHQALAFAVGLGGAALVATIAAGGLGVARVWYPSLLAGAAFVYVDLLTVVPGQWLLVAAVVGLVAHGTGRAPIDTAGWMLLAGSAWMVGYAGMWFGKWTYAALVLGRQRVVDDVRSTIDERLDGESTLVEPGFGNGIGENLDAFGDRPFVAILLLVTAIVVVAGIVRGPVLDTATRTVIASAAVVPFVWFEILSNHSQIHAWFTYRSIPMALGVVAMAFLARRPEPASVSEPDSVSTT